MTSKPTGRLTTAQRLMVEQWLPMANRMARMFAERHGRLHAYLDDLKQAAAEGLIRAALKYDDARGVQFNTYAFPWITTYIREAGRRYLNVTSVHASGGANHRKAGFDKRSDADVYAAGFNALVSDTPEYDEKMDAARLWEEAFESIASRVPVYGGSGKNIASVNPARDADIFLRSEFLGETYDNLGKEWGHSREWARQRILKIRPYFDEWANEVRKEAA